MLTALSNPPIKPAIAKGNIVLSDRFDGSTFAYQGVARKLDLKMIEKINNWSKDYIKVDVVIYIDISPEEAKKRKRNKKNDRLDREKKLFHESVRKGFLKQIANNNNWKIVKGIGKVDDIAINIQKIIKKI